MLTLWQRRFAFPVHINVDTRGWAAQRAARTMRYIHVEIGTRTTSLKQEVVTLENLRDVGPVEVLVSQLEWRQGVGRIQTHRSPRRGLHKVTALNLGNVDTLYMVFEGYMKPDKVELAF